MPVTDHGGRRPAAVPPRRGRNGTLPPR